ncbi:MAG: M20/M25/M40 family metallo-hydrolase [Bacillota bacterium]
MTQSIDCATVRQAATYLSELIKIDTTNPPGNEIAAAKFIKDIFEAFGQESEIVEPAPGRGSIVARMKGSGEKRPLLLLSHLDVVTAEAKDWAHPPFCGEIIDGEIWGRGALDCKNVAVLWLVTMLHMKQKGVVPKRDIIFAATADEEAGGIWGVKWLVENRPELVDAEYCLNEGGGGAMKLGDVTYYTYQTGEKNTAWFQMTARGTAGHASVPIPDNSVVKLAQAITKLGAAKLPIHITDTVRAFVNGLAEAQPADRAQLLRAILDPARTEQVLSLSPLEGHQLHSFNAMLRNTATPTILRAGEKTNVIPGEAHCQVDGRILPGQTADDLEREVREVVGDLVDIEINRAGTATESDPDTELAAAIQKALGIHAAGTRVVPFLVTGATDARFLRPRGMTVYGFAPMLPDVDARTVHGVNERLSLGSLEFGLKVVWDVIMELVS